MFTTVGPSILLVLRLGPLKFICHLSAWLVHYEVCVKVVTEDLEFIKNRQCQCPFGNLWPLDLSSWQGSRRKERCHLASAALRPFAGVMQC